MSDPLLAADAAARRTALDTDASFIVQAPAGSGKTELLTQRVLALLARVESPERILALTFTRKAAAEMRHRILGALAAAADPQPPAAEHAQTTWRLARAARAHAETLGWQLDAAPQRLQIGTIDAWCSSLVRRSPLLSEAGGSLRITEDATALYLEAAQRTLATLDDPGPVSAALQTVLLHLDHRSDRLTGFLVALLAGRDRWRGVIGLAGPDDDIRPHMEAQLATLVESLCHDALGRLPPALLTAWWQSAVYAAGQLPAGHALREAVALGSLPLAPEDAAHWRPLVELLLTRDGDVRRKVDKRQGFPTARDGGDDAAKARHGELLAALGELPGAAEALARLAALPSPAYDDGQWAILVALLRLLGRAMAELQLLFSAQGVVDHTEVTLRALQALGNEQAPTDLLLKLDDRLEHLLIDEFQDTSDLQMQLLRMLTLDWTPGDGRSLFLVGDPMQSIYRFRNANVGLFLRARDQGIGDIALQPLRLTRNFRSQAGIVDWVNRVFPHLLPDEDLQRGAVAYADAIAHHPPEAEAVHWHIGDAEAEAARIVEICRALPDGERAAILVRGRSHLRDIVPALRAAGLRYRAVDIESLADRPVVHDLRALTRALLHPGDRLAWLALLRAPWCGLRLASLHRLCAGLAEGEPLWPRLAAAAEGDTLAGDDGPRLRRILPPLAEAMAGRGRRPLRARVERLWRALDGPACAGDRAGLDDADAFLDLLERLAGQAAWIDPAALDRGLAALRASPDPDAGERIQLMTMHKAKGLQFEHVLLPGLARRAARDAKPAIIQSSAIDADGHEIPLLAPIHAAEASGDPLFDFLARQIEAQRDDAETGRLLYVAATRAIRRLHLFADVPIGENGPQPGTGLLRRLWPGVADEVAAACAEQRPEVAPASSTDAGAEPAASAPALRRLPLAWQAPSPAAGLPIPASPPASATPLFDWAGEPARITGVLYHRWMAALVGQPAEAWTSARLAGLRPALAAAALVEGLGAADADLVAARVITALDNTLADPVGRWLLTAHPAGHWSEYALMTLIDGRPRRFVVDRSFIDADGQRWIVDFKTGQHEGGELSAFLAAERERYTPQLHGYARLFAGDARPPRLALYYPLIDAEHRLLLLDPP